MIDSLTVNRFLRVLCGGSDRPVLWQTFTDPPPKPDPDSLAHAFGPCTFAQVRPQLDALNRDETRAGIFLQVNHGPRRGKAFVNELRALFADDDDKDPHAPPIELPLPPSIVVRSSGEGGGRKAHYYWCLIAGEDPAAFEAVQRRIALTLGTDKTMVNLDRVMRLPGTYHHKGAPQRVQLVEAHAERRYTIAQMNAALDALVAAGKSREGRGTTGGGITSFVLPGEVTSAQRASGERIRRWLIERGRAFKETAPYEFRLEACALNPAHGALMKIRAESKGGFFAGCFHESCGANKNVWRRVRDAIGGFDMLPPGAFVRGDHTELARRYIADENTGLEAPIVWAEGLCWKYSGTTGLFSPTTIDEERVALLRYAGSPLGTQGKVLRLDDKDITGTLKVAHSVIARPEFFRGAPPGITFTNGHLRVDETAATLCPPSPDHHARLGLPFAYKPGRPVPKLMQFFRDIFRDEPDLDARVACLQEFLGACLFGIAPRYEVAMILHGESAANGKSRWLRIVRALFPPNVVTAVPPQTFGQDYAKAQLVGSRLNIVSELPETDILDSGPFKAIVSGDPTEGRNPYEKKITFIAAAGHLFATNRLPGVVDSTRGFWRRVIIITFNRSFENDPARDTAIAETIIAAELPAIAAWAVEGGLRLLAQGRFTVPPSSEAAKQHWRVDSDAVALFLRDCTTDAPGSVTTPLMILYSCFCDWARANGHQRMTSTNFLKRLQLLGIRHTPGARGGGSVAVVICNAPPTSLFSA